MSITSIEVKRIGRLDNKHGIYIYIYIYSYKIHNMSIIFYIYIFVCVYVCVSMCICMFVCTMRALSALRICILQCALIRQSKIIKFDK